LREDPVGAIQPNSPAFFERPIIDRPVAMGHGASRRDRAAQLGRSGEGGVDRVINEDQLGSDRVRLQANRCGAAGVVGRPRAPVFVGGLVELGATEGVFVTASIRP
jgi:restriction system protein